MGTVGSSSKKLWLVAVMCLVAGYFIGREHVKYELRMAMQGAVEDLQHTLAGSPASLNVAPAPEPSAKPQSKPDVIMVQLVKKGFSPKNLDDGKFDEDITFTIGFTNKTGKNIRAFDGILEFTDLLGNSILESKVEINERIANGATLSWDGGLHYNQFMAPHQRLRGEPQENLKITFSPHKLLFEDGTTQEF
jgi:hypothetical protein